MRRSIAVAIVVLVGAVVSPASGAVSIVDAETDAEKFTFRNSDADWTIWRKCLPPDGTLGAVGPGYIGRVRLNKAYGSYPAGSLVLNDRVPRSPEDEQVGKFRGGLGGFAFSHARGGDARSPSLEGAPAQSVYQDIGTRTCYNDAVGQRGVYAVTASLTPRVTDGVGRATYTVYLRDEKGATTYGANGQAIAAVTYDTYVYDNRVRQQISITLWPVRLDWDPTYRYAFIKEAGFRFSTRGGNVNYKGLSVYSAATDSTAENRIGGAYGSAPQGSRHFGQTYRSRIRFDWTDANGTLLACDDALRPCLNVRAWGGSNDYWLNGGMDQLAKDLDAAMPWAPTDQLNSNEGNGPTTLRWDCDGADPFDHRNEGRAPDGHSAHRLPQNHPSGDPFAVPAGGAIDDGADEINTATGAITKDNVHWTKFPASPGDMNARQWEYFNGDGSHPAMATPGWLGGRGGFDCEPLAVDASSVTGRTYVNWTTYWINTM